MRVGWRVRAKGIPGSGDSASDYWGVQGVVLRTQFSGSASTEECTVLWDTGKTTVEMGEDLAHCENRNGDFFLTSKDGMGTIPMGVVERPNSLSKMRDLRHNETTSFLFLRKVFGMPIKGKRVSTMNKVDTLIQDIQRQVAHGTPLKGSPRDQLGRNTATPHKLETAKAFASGTGLCVRRGPLMAHTVINPSHEGVRYSKIFQKLWNDGDSDSRKILNYSRRNRK